VFINAWNEWAEGAHLEPDMRYGRAYLDETLAALRSIVPDRVSTPKDGAATQAKLAQQAVT
jgi:hypothetical protein